MNSCFISISKVFRQTRGVEGKYGWGGLALRALPPWGGGGDAYDSEQT